MGSLVAVKLVPFFFLASQNEVFGTILFSTNGFLNLILSIFVAIKPHQRKALIGDKRLRI